MILRPKVHDLPQTTLLNLRTCVNNPQNAEEGKHLPAMQVLEYTEDQLREALADPEFRRAYRRSLWYEGDLSADLRPNGQLWLYNFVRNTVADNPGPDPFVLETHRRLGKSNFALRIACERAIKRPGQRIIYAAPTKEQALPIVRPNLAVVCQKCPPELKPRPFKFSYEFRNPRWPHGSESSVIEVYGVNSNVDAARGGHCDMAVIDEAGFIRRLEYFMSDVLSWQFLNRPDPLCIMISTPPRTMDHPFITTYVPRARAKGRYMGIPASRNPDFTHLDEQYVLQIVGSKHSIAWRREAEIEHITDPDAMIVPEWSYMREHSVMDWQRPDAFYPLVSMDLGWSDYTHVLFAYVDFTAQKLIIEDEYWTHYESEGPIVDAIRAKEHTLWFSLPTNRLTQSNGNIDPVSQNLAPNLPLVHKVRRIADADPLVLRSFYSTHRMSFEPAIRHDKDATLSALRHLILSDKLRVHPRCVQLIYQLDNGIWNERRTDYERSEVLGHCDGISALAYLNRQAPWKKNPFPPKPINLKTQHRNIAAVRREHRERREHPFVRAFRR